MSTINACWMFDMSTIVCIHVLLYVVLVMIKELLPLLRGPPPPPTPQSTWNLVFTSCQHIFPVIPVQYHCVNTLCEKSTFCDKSTYFDHAPYPFCIIWGPFLPPSYHLAIDRGVFDIPNSLLHIGTRGPGKKPLFLAVGARSLLSCRLRMEERILPCNAEYTAALVLWV